MNSNNQKVIKILGFAGSTRKDSFNKKLVRAGLDHAQKLGAQITFVDLADFNLPLFDEDLEKNSPPADAQKLKEIFIDHQALLIASPEYNSSISAVLKNAIDWVSRSAVGEPPLIAFRGKVAGLMSASPGGLGGLRGLVHLRSILGNISVLVIPEQYALGQAQQAFDTNAKLSDPKSQASLERVVGSLYRVSSLINSDTK